MTFKKKIKTTNSCITKNQADVTVPSSITTSVSYKERLWVKAALSVVYLSCYVKVIAVGGKCQWEMAFQINTIL